MSQTNSKVITVFEHIRHYGPSLLLSYMTISKTGQKANGAKLY